MKGLERLISFLLLLLLISAGAVAYRRYVDGLKGKLLTVQIREIYRAYSMAKVSGVSKELKKLLANRTPWDTELKIITLPYQSKKLVLLYVYTRGIPESALRYVDRTLDDGNLQKGAIRYMQAWHRLTKGRLEEEDEKNLGVLLDLENP